jgi:hypothetical protein
VKIFEGAKVRGDGDVAAQVMLGDGFAEVFS